MSIYLVGECRRLSSLHVRLYPPLPQLQVVRSLQTLGEEGQGQQVVGLVFRSGYNYCPVSISVIMSTEASCDLYRRGGATGRGQPRLHHRSLQPRAVPLAALLLLLLFLLAALLLLALAVHLPPQRVVDLLRAYGVERRGVRRPEHVSVQRLAQLIDWRLAPSGI